MIQIKLSEIDRMTEIEFDMSTLNKVTLHNGSIIYISYINSISNGTMFCEQCSSCKYLEKRKLQAN